MSALDLKSQRKAGYILAAILIIEGWFVLPVLIHPAHYLLRWGLAPGGRPAALPGWLLGMLVLMLFVLHSCRFPSVREHLFRPSGLKLLSLGVAVVAGIFEEYFFRGVLMDGLRHRGWNSILQVLASALAFGFAHGIWALFRGSMRAGIGAILATGYLGGMLAVVYLLGDRSLGPCILAHFGINALAEPGLVLAAVRGEMGKAANLKTA